MANRSPDRSIAPKSHGLTPVWSSDKPIKKMENWSREKAKACAAHTEITLRAESMCFAHGILAFFQTKSMSGRRAVQLTFLQQLRKVGTNSSGMNLNILRMA
jgi:hypothetical protein